MRRGTRRKTKIVTPLKPRKYSKKITRVNKPVKYKYPEFANPPGPPISRSHKQLLSAWTPKRIIRLQARIDYHYQRALFKSCIAETISTEDLINRYMYFGNKCAYCQRSGQRLHMDHFIPIHLNGGHQLTNLICSCRACNMAKGAADPHQWYKGHPCFSIESYNKIKYALKTSKPYALPEVTTKGKMPI